MARQKRDGGGGPASIKRARESCEGGTSDCLIGSPGFWLAEFGSVGEDKQERLAVCCFCGRAFLREVGCLCWACFVYFRPQTAGEWNKLWCIYYNVLQGMSRGMRVDLINRRVLDESRVRVVL